MIELGLKCLVSMKKYRSFIDGMLEEFLKYGLQRDLRLAKA